MPNPDFRIIPSFRRKRIAFRIAPDGILEVLSPIRVKESTLIDLIIKNRHTIERLRQQTPVKTRPEFIENEKFWLLGKQFPLHLTGRLRIFDQKFMIPNGNEVQKKASLVTLYRELAWKIITERLNIYQVQTGCSPNKIKITSASSRWGSCSSKKTVSFSWKLVQCPLECIDYVIVHELAHLIEMNHSPVFWKLIAETLPDYRQKKEQLNAFAAKLPLWD